MVVLIPMTTSTVGGKWHKNFTIDDFCKSKINQSNSFTVIISFPIFYSYETNLSLYNIFNTVPLFQHPGYNLHK